MEHFLLEVLQLNHFKLKEIQKGYYQSLEECQVVLSYLKLELLVLLHPSFLLQVFQSFTLLTLSLYLPSNESIQLRNHLVYSDFHFLHSAASWISKAVASAVLKVEPLFHVYEGIQAGRQSLMDLEGNCLRISYQLFRHFQFAVSSSLSSLYFLQDFHKDANFASHSATISWLDSLELVMKMGVLNELSFHKGSQNFYRHRSLTSHHAFDYLYFWEYLIAFSRILR